MFGAKVSVAADGDWSRWDDRIRSECAGVRACFREISVGAIGLTLPAVGAVLYAAGVDNPYPAIGCAGLVLMLMGVQRLGIHKFSTANRLYGLELCLERSRRTPNAWNDDLHKVGWEEAFLAWRVVQATVFARVYKVPKHAIERMALFADTVLQYLYSPRQKEKASPNWWQHGAVVRSGQAEFHPGSYLQRMFAMLTAVQWLACLPLGFVAYDMLMGDWRGDPSSLLIIGLGVLAPCVVLLNLRSLKKRRLLLEEELMSIPSCAVMWEAVLRAHVTALPKGQSGEDYVYLDRLCRLALGLAETVEEIPRLIGESPDKWAEMAKLSSDPEIDQGKV